MFKNKSLNKSKSLSKKLSIILIIGVSFVSSLTTLLVYSINKNTALEHFEKNNKAIITQLKGALLQPIWNIDNPAIKLTADSFTRDKSLASLEIYDESGESLYQYTNNYKKDLVFIEDNIINETQIIAKIKLSFSKHELNVQLYNILLTNLALLLMTLSTIIILTLIVFKILLKKPLEQLISTAMAFSNGNYDSRINMNFIEFMPLINVLNSMGRKISKQVDMLNEHKLHLEDKVHERTLELAKEKQYISSIMNSQNSMLMTSDGNKIKTINNAFIDFFSINTQGEYFKGFTNNFIDISNNSALLYINNCAKSEKWLNYIYENQKEIHKIKLNDNTFTVRIDSFSFEGEVLYTIVLTDITELERIKDEIEEINLHTRESIEYSALIQHSLIPSKDLFLDYFSDSFLIWQPKDIVGGDIYLFDTLRNDDECLLMLIDCTGHGVPGAFVSMLVKAIEKQITTYIKASNNEINTGNILKEFNKEMKNILEQKKSKTSVNAGFDGGIIYFNKAKNIVRYSGARTPLYYIEDGELKVIKGDRHSVGYKHSDINYKFTEHEINVKEGMTFYLSSDGFIDQSGGKKDFSFGRKKFESLLKEHHSECLEKQEILYLECLKNYQGDNERYDDITFLGLKI